MWIARKKSCFTNAMLIIQSPQAAHLASSSSIFRYYDLRSQAPRTQLIELAVWFPISPHIYEEVFHFFPVRGELCFITFLFFPSLQFCHFNLCTKAPPSLFWSYMFRIILPQPFFLLPRRSRESNPGPCIPRSVTRPLLHQPTLFKQF